MKRVDCGWWWVVISAWHAVCTLRWQETDVHCGPGVGPTAAAPPAGDRGHVTWGRDLGPATAACPTLLRSTCIYSP